MGSEESLKQNAGLTNRKRRWAYKLDKSANSLKVQYLYGKMEAAYKKVVSNKGAPGVDEMTTEDLKAYLQTNWVRIKEELLTGRYKHLSSILN